jgi:hypothetical protein
MGMNNNAIGYLENIRKKQGNKNCREVFNKILKDSKDKAVALINEEHITFPCLFLLFHDIKAATLYPNLNNHNRNVYDMIQRTLSPNRSNFSNNDDSEHKILKWILETGSDEYELNEQYEYILDITVSVLINTYLEKSILPIVVEMIFERNRTGRYIHDLVWSAFRANHPLTLKMIAERLKSANKEDVELACRLLNIEVINRENNSSFYQTLYNKYIEWLEENSPFLYSTGENMQYSSTPVFYLVDYERKYIFKGLSTYTKTSAEPSDDERDCLQAFKTLSQEDQMLLADYSYKIHNRDIGQWEELIHQPLSEQIKAAKENRGDWA